MKKRLALATLVMGVVSMAGLRVLANEIEINIHSRYLNFPISHQEERSTMTFEVEGKPDLSVVIRLAPGEADYWVFRDVSDLIGKTINQLRRQCESIE